MCDGGDDCTERGKENQPGSNEDAAVAGGLDVWGGVGVRIVGGGAAFSGPVSFGRMAIDGFLAICIVRVSVLTRERRADYLSCIV